MRQATKYAVKKIESVSELLDLVTKEYDNCEQLLFRGQREDWPLLPKLARLRLNANYDLNHAEIQMLDLLRSCAVPFLDSPPESDWDWLAVAQHHGMATRLLDWTENPLAALWFAIEKPADSGKSAVVWLLVPAEDDIVKGITEKSPFKSSRTMIFRPRHLTRRITVQMGWSTVHKFDRELKKFVPLEKNHFYKAKLTKISVPASKFSTIRSDLDRLNINASSLFPDLDGLCRDIEWKYSLFDDEVI
jgi:hypothetical protein